MEADVHAAARVAAVIAELEALDPRRTSRVRSAADRWARARPGTAALGSDPRLRAAVEHADDAIRLSASDGGPGLSRAIDALLRVHQLLTARGRSG